MILHNVSDKRVSNAIGSWKVEGHCLHPTSMMMTDVDRYVIWRWSDDGAQRCELGQLSSWKSDGTAWVRFHKGDTAAACLMENLHFVKGPA